MDQAQKVWIGLDLGGTKMLAVVYDDAFKELGKAKCKTRGNEGPAAGLARMTESIEDALQNAGCADRSRIAGIGIGCPGPINPSLGEIVEAPNLGWFRVPIGPQISSAFGCPTVISNDVDAGVFAEYQFGAGRESRRLVGIFPGTGIGAGAVIDGKLVQGDQISCMELGHIPLFPETSGKGQNTSTLENECSRLKIAAEAARAAYRGQAPKLLALCGTDLANITSGKLAESIASGDTVIEDIVTRSAIMLGNGVATLIHLLAPDTIVLGGGLVEAMPKLYLENVRKSAKRRVLGPYKESFKVVAAKLGDDAGVLGAAAWAKTQIHGNDSTPARPVFR